MKRFTESPIIPGKDTGTLFKQPEIYLVLRRKMIRLKVDIMDGK